MAPSAPAGARPALARDASRAALGLAPLAALVTALCLALAPATPAQILDDDVFVVTTTGLFRVANQTGGQVVLRPADLGLAGFRQPTVTWIPDSPYLLLTLRDPGGGGRVLRIDASGSTPVVDDQTALFLDPLGSVLDPVDAHACLVTDRLFVLDNTTGRVLAVDDPADPAGPMPADVSVWVVSDVDDPRSLAVNAAKVDYGVVVVGRTEIWRYSETKQPELLADASSGQYHQTAANPVTGEYYVLNTHANLFGKLFSGGIGSAILSFNASQLCASPVKGPEDMVWDASRKRMVVVAGEGVDCLFGGIASGQSNTVVRMPYAIGPIVPKLLTAPVNDIDGLDADLAVVRWSEPQIARRGSPGQTLAGTSFRLTPGGYLTQATLDDNMYLLAQGGPASAPTWMALGLELVELGLAQGPVLMPAAPLWTPVTLDAEGELSLLTVIPNDAVLAGLVTWVQLWADDSAAAGGPRWVHTQVAGYAIGD